MKRIQIILFLALTAAIIIAVWQVTRLDKRVAFVTTAKVYEQFALKKELERIYQDKQIGQQTLLDSLRFKIQKMSLEQTTQKLEEMQLAQKQYLIKEREYAELNEKLLASYTQQVWTQLNQYISDFGQGQGYQYIFGATGQGNLMYADQADDVTDEVIKYINIRYAGN